MAATRTNAFCKICGKGYHVCRSCLEQKTFQSWRGVTDSIDHYVIYAAIHGYTLSKDREKARMELEGCDLSEMEHFKPEIQAVLKEILAEPEQEV